MSKSKVYFTKEITPEGLVRVYDALGRELQGKVCVKISTGEPGGHNFLNPDLISDLVHKLDGTIVECLTAYRGKRNTVSAHKQTFEDHGFTKIGPCDILDEEGTLKIPVEGKRLHGYDIVGSRMANYNSSLVLSHFKGHMVAGFGGGPKKYEHRICVCSWKSVDSLVRKDGKQHLDVLWNAAAGRISGKHGGGVEGRRGLLQARKLGLH